VTHAEAVHEVAIPYKVNRIRSHQALATLISLWAGFASLKLWFALSNPPIIFSDSKAYEAVARFPILSRGFVAGQRPMLIPLMLKLTGTPTSFVVLQTVLSALCWGLLALAVARRIQNKWGGVLAGAVILAFATAPQIEIWDKAVLTETMALSFIALLCAEALWAGDSFTTWWKVAVILTLVGFVSARDEDIWTTLLFGGAFLAIMLVLRVKEKRRSKPALTFIIICVLISGVFEFTASDSKRNIPNVEHVMFVRIFPYPSRLSWFASHGMPEERRIAASPLDKGITAGSAEFKFVDLSNPKFKQLSNWMQHDATRTYIEWLILHPFYDVSVPFQTPRLSEVDPANGDILGYDLYPIPAWQSALGHVIFPAWEEVLLMSLVASFLLWKRNFWRLRHTQLVGLLACAGFLTLFIAWHGDGYEVVRHMLEGNVEVRVGVLVLLVLGALTAPANRTSST
jgi:hypothetical protein